MAGPLLAQVDTNALHAKYGPPVEEVFAIRPEVTLSVKYGENRQACTLEIRPPETASSVITAALIQQVVDEIVPPSTRGKPGLQLNGCSGASCRTNSEYEFMVISQASTDVSPNPESRNPVAVIRMRACQTSK